MKPDHLAPDERRHAGEILECRAAPEGSTAQAEVVGYAAVFNRESRVIGKGQNAFVERIRPGAFARALRQRQDVRALVNHDPTLIMGRVGNGTLFLEEDGRGLKFRLVPNGTTYSRDAVEAIRRKDLPGASFGFRVAAGGEAWELGAGPGGVDIRTLTDLDLFDVSPTAFPAYEDTSVAMRSLESARAQLAEEDGEDRELRGPAMPAWSDEEERAWSARHPGELRSCFHGHLGAWLLEPMSARALLQAVKAGTVRGREAEAAAPAAPAGPPPKPYEVRPGGLAVLQVRGVMGKGKFADARTPALRRAIRAAATDAEVRGLLLVVDSPGGQAAGTYELGEEVRRFSAGGKPCHAFVEDCGASGAFWLVSQAQRATVNPMGSVGSIGVVSLVVDESKRYEKEGVKVHVVATGPAKAALREGQPVAPEDLERVADHVGFLFQGFRSAVQRGRGLSDEAFQAVADGRMFPAPAALKAGLVDAIGTEEEAVQELLRAVMTGPGVGAPPSPVAYPPLAAMLRQQRAQEATLELDRPPAD